MTRVARNRYTHIKNEDIVKLYLKGMSSNQIAGLFNVSSTLILRRLDEVGVGRRKPNTYPNLTKELLEDLYNIQKLSSRDIAAKVGCSNRLVLKRLKKFNIQIRLNAGDKSFTSEERKEKWGMRLDEHPRWKGGVTAVSRLIRNRLAWVSKERLALDGYKCGECGAPRNLHAHHLRRFSDIVQDILSENPKLSLLDEKERLIFVDICERDSRLTDINNLITLCDLCHHNQHSEEKFEVIHFEILEKEWREYVDKNHFNMSLKEMRKTTNVDHHRTIAYMNHKGLLFAFQNKYWLQRQLETKNFSSIAYEFHSAKYPCRAPDIKYYADAFSLLTKDTSLILTKYNEGLSVRKIGEELGMTKWEIKKSLKSYGIERTTNHLRLDITYELVYPLFKSGMSMNQISKELDCSLNKVSKVLRDNGVNTNIRRYKVKDDGIGYTLFDDIQGLISMYRSSDKTVKEVAQHYKIPEWAVRELLKENNISIDLQRNKIKVDDVVLKRLLSDGHTILEVSAILQVSESVVRARMKELGILRQIDETSILKLYSENHCLRDTADKLNLSPITVAKYLRKNDIHIKHRSTRDDIPLEEAKRLYLQGWTFRKLAERYKCSTTLIQKKLDIRKPTLKDVISKETLHDLIVIKGLGYQDIGKKYNTSRGAVWRLAQNYGINK